MSSGWTREQMQRFEEALRVHGSGTPDCWHHIALAVGGGRSADDVRRFYEELVRSMDPPAGVGRKHLNI